NIYLYCFKCMMKSKKCPLFNKYKCNKLHYRRNKYLFNIINNLNIICPNSIDFDNKKNNTNINIINNNQSFSCSWNGKLQDLNNHLKICNYNKIPCIFSNFGCDY